MTTMRLSTMILSMMKRSMRRTRSRRRRRNRQNAAEDAEIIKKRIDFSCNYDNIVLQGESYL